MSRRPKVEAVRAAREAKEEGVLARHCRASSAVAERAGDQHIVRGIVNQIVDVDVGQAGTEQLPLRRRTVDRPDRTKNAAAAGAQPTDHQRREARHRVDRHYGLQLTGLRAEIAGDFR